MLRVLRGEPLDIVAREVSMTAADLSARRDAFVEAGAASLKTRPRDDRDERVEPLQLKLRSAGRRGGLGGASAGRRRR